VVGGWVWKPAIVAGENKFDEFLAPVFRTAGSTGPHDGSVVQTGQETPALVGEGAAGSASNTIEHDESTEHILMIVSVLAGVGGAFFAYLFYVRRPEFPAQIARSLNGLYRTVFNKYYVDEAYQAVVVDPLVQTSDKILWRGVDAAVIDGAVNGAGSTAKYFSDRLRRMQSGNIRSYAGWVALGAALALIYMIWFGVQ
jgi:NADH-quinone oxidoreductase subunit L